MDPREDPISYSRPDLVAVTHTRLELSVNFDNHVLKGKAILTIEKKTSTCNELVLDNYRLKIVDVTDYSTGERLKKTIQNHNNNFGSKFTITLPSVDRAVGTIGGYKRMKVIDKYQIQIEYETDPKSPALYWLKPEQTSNFTHPLLISNSKLTYARAIFPCQDTPSNRITFDSKITVPIGLKVMMPGTREMREADGQIEYTFSGGRNITLAPHEIYIIVGSLREEGITNNDLRCNLWTEEKYLLQGTTAIHRIMPMLAKIKESYDFTDEVNVCLLPPNMPEFDMQYPHVTFVSSTILEGHFSTPSILLEGHYSMIDTIVQNIIESWIGRIVKIEHFKDLWLIKGLSTFIYRMYSINNIIDDEHDIVDKLEICETLKVKGINNVLNMPELLDTVSLVPVFTDELLPMNIIKYVSEKGCVFLNYLQHILGDPTKFRHFLVKYIFVLRFTYGFLRTDRFTTFLYECFSHKRELLDAVEWNAWLNRPGFPLSYHDSMTRRKTNWHLKGDRWIVQQKDDLDLIEEVHRTNDFVKIEFLTYILALPAVPRAKLQMLRFAFLDDQKICEIRFLWLRLCIKSGKFRIIEALQFANKYCMPKYACPIFHDLYELDGKTRKVTQSWFKDPYKRSKMLPEIIEKLSSILKVELRSTVDLRDTADVAYY